MGIINYPNLEGGACNYIDDGIYLQGNKSLLGFPNAMYDNEATATINITAPICINQPVAINAEVECPKITDTYTWSSNGGSIDNPFNASANLTPTNVATELILTVNVGCDTATATVLLNASLTCECANNIPLPNCDDNNCATTDVFNTLTCACEHELQQMPNCTDSDTYTIDWYNENTCECEHQYMLRGVVLPNAFSPNNDGVNDVFAPIGDALKTMHLQIFNRWGAMVYESDSSSSGWNGTFNDKEQEIGVYVYLFTYTSFAEPQRVQIQHGNVTLLR